MQYRVVVACLLLVGLPHSARAVGIQGLGDLLGGEFRSEAHGVSANGQVVVGMSYGSGTNAFRWTATGGMVGLADLAGGSFDRYAWDVSPDRSVVVGESTSATGAEAIRWTEASGMQGPGKLAGDTSSVARAPIAGITRSARAPGSRAPLARQPGPVALASLARLCSAGHLNGLRINQVLLPETARA